MRKAAGNVIAAVSPNVKIQYLSTKEAVNFPWGVVVLVCLMYHLGIVVRLLITATLRA
jgi:hypothetical protein